MAEAVDSHDARPLPPGTGTMGMWIFLAALSMLFIASLLLYVLLLAQQTTWPPPGMPSIPKGFWIATLGILYSSVTIQLALRAARRGDKPALVRQLTLTLVLGLAFLGLQIYNWYGLWEMRIPNDVRLFKYIYYVLPGLHALHVLGGVLPLAVVRSRAAAGAYTPDHYPGVLHSAMYWHFLDIVWLTMFALFIFTM